MSGSIVLFADQWGDQAAVYLHGDDDSVHGQLDAFFANEKKLIGTSPRRYTNRFDDPQYLAARFVVYVSNSSGTGVGVAKTDDRADTNFRVLCTNETDPGVVPL